jgi:hypothetical protein
MVRAGNQEAHWGAKAGSFREVKVVIPVKRKNGYHKECFGRRAGRTPAPKGLCA